MSVRFRLEGGEFCFDEFAGRGARLGVATSLPTCDGDLFVFGVTGRTAARVRVRVRGAAPVEVSTHRAPAGSRVRARYFMAVLPRDSVLRGVRALDAAGMPIGRARLPGSGSEVDC